MSKIKVLLAMVLGLLLVPAGALHAAEKWTIGAPITTYWAGPGYGGKPLTEADARRLADGGWNLVWAASPEELDVAHKFHLRAMLSSPLISPLSLDNPPLRRKLDGLIDQVKNHPALYAYYIIDEPGVPAMDGLGKLVDYLRQRDPAHLSYINLFPTYASNQQLGAFGDTVTAYKKYLADFFAKIHPRLLSYDHYHFQADGHDGEQYFLNLGLIRQAALDHQVPFLNIVQACTWHPDMRAPTPDELRWLVNTSLAYGAQGISYFVYSYEPFYKPASGQMITPDGQPTDLYKAASELNPHFVAIASQLQPLHSLAVYHYGMSPPGTQAAPENFPFQFDPPVPHAEYQPPKPVEGLLMGVFGENQPSHLFVVNLDYKTAAKTTLVGPSQWELFDPHTGEWKKADSKRVELQLPPGGGALVRVGL